MPLPARGLVAQAPQWLLAGTPLQGGPWPNLEAYYAPPAVRATALLLLLRRRAPPVTQQSLELSILLAHLRFWRRLLGLRLALEIHESMSGLYQVFDIEAGAVAPHDSGLQVINAAVRFRSQQLFCGSRPFLASLLRGLLPGLFRFAGGSLALLDLLPTLALVMLPELYQAPPGGSDLILGQGFQLGLLNPSLHVTHPARGQCNLTA